MDKIQLLKIVEFIESKFNNVKKINTERILSISKVINKLENSDEESLMWLNEKNKN